MNINVPKGLESLAHKAEKKGIELASLVHSNVPGAVRGDPGRLRQVLLNLIGNAVKFTEQGEVVLYVHPAEVGNLVQFTISDTGIGIPEAKLAAIFDAFSQEDSSITRKFGGTGLGLTVTKKIIDAKKINVLPKKVVAAKEAPAEAAETPAEEVKEETPEKVE